jgi:hypothetical protein
MHLPHHMHLAPFRSGLLDSASTRGNPGNSTPDCLSTDPAAQDRYIDEVFLRSILRERSGNNDLAGHRNYWVELPPDRSSTRSHSAGNSHSSCNCDLIRFGPFQSCDTDAGGGGIAGLRILVVDVTCYVFRGQLLSHMHSFTLSSPVTAYHPLSAQGSFVAMSSCCSRWSSHSTAKSCSVGSVNSMPSKTPIN